MNDDGSMSPVRVLMWSFVLVMMLFVGVVGGFIVNLQVRSQGIENQKHTDCVAAVFAQTHPPKCARVIQQLVRDGIVPKQTS